jgi:hypothetical protein
LPRDTFHEQVQYISALNRLGDIIHKWRWQGNRVGELEDAIEHCGENREQLWRTLCALVIEFSDDARAHALIYAHLHSEKFDMQRRMIARMVMEMAPRVPGALDELVSGMANAGYPLTMQTVVAAALEQDPSHGPMLSLFEAHDERKYPIPAPRADWRHRSVGAARRMGDLQRRLLAHPGFGSAVVNFLRARIGQADVPYRPGLDKETTQAALAWGARVQAEIEIIRILRRAIDAEVAACGVEEREWVTCLTKLRNDITAEFDRMFVSMFGVVGDDAESITDFVLHGRIEHRAYFPHALEKLRDCMHKGDVRERLETFLLTSYVLTSEKWVRGAPGAEGPRARAWDALRRMLWRPGDPDRFVERIIARSIDLRGAPAISRTAMELRRFEENNRNNEAWLELPTPRNGYGYRPLTEVFVGRDAFADFVAAVSPQEAVSPRESPDLNRRYPDDSDAA